MGLVTPPYTRGTWHIASPGREDGGIPPRATCGQLEDSLKSLDGGPPRARDMWACAACHDQLDRGHSPRA